MCSETGPAVLKATRVEMETSMSMTVSLTMYRHGNNPPVHVYIYYKHFDSTDWKFAGIHTADDNDIKMSEYIGDLTSSSKYDIRIEAFNNRETSKTTVQHLSGYTRGMPS